MGQIPTPRSLMEIPRSEGGYDLLREVVVDGGSKPIAEEPVRLAADLRARADRVEAVEAARIAAELDRDESTHPERFQRVV